MNPHILEALKFFGLMLLISLGIAAPVGFLFLKLYEQFRKGLKEKKRLRIWAAFSGVSFMGFFFINLLKYLDKTTSSYTLIGWAALSSLVTSVFMGFAFLKFYEEFRKGIEEKNRLRIWSVFFGAIFTIVFLTLSMRVST